MMILGSIAAGWLLLTILCCLFFRAADTRGRRSWS